MNIGSLTTLLEVVSKRPNGLGSLLATGGNFADILGNASSALNGASVSTGGIADLLATVPASKTASTSATSVLSPTGRNMALFDPESAYSMMSTINSKEITYKAQYSSLEKMSQRLSDMNTLGRSLADLPDSASASDIQAAVKKFADGYNQWRRDFDDVAQSGGLLADTKAAKVARYELDQSVNNRFAGVDHGFNGLKDLGIGLSPATHRISFSSAKLDEALATNPQGVLNTLREFGGNFAKSAALLVSADNFVKRQLNNLDRAIDFIGENRTDWQQEFGLGDVPQPSPQVARALAAYQQSHA